jgi:hypothetical protein
MRKEEADKRMIECKFKPELNKKSEKIVSERVKSHKEKSRKSTTLTNEDNITKFTNYRLTSEEEERKAEKD